MSGREYGGGVIGRGIKEAMSARQAVLVPGAARTCRVEKLESGVERRSTTAKRVIYLVKREGEAQSALSAIQGVPKLEVTLTLDHARGMVR